MKEWGEKLKRQHRPANLLELPPFMEPKKEQVRPAASSGDAPSQREKASTQPEPVSEAPTRRLICSKCGTKISFAEGKFCWNNAVRFAGEQYCRAHQALF